MQISVGFICTHCVLNSLILLLLNNFPTPVVDGGFELLNCDASSK
jgi:hypothetical protein